MIVLLKLRIRFLLCLFFFFPYVNQHHSLKQNVYILHLDVLKSSYFTIYLAICLKWNFLRGFFLIESVPFFQTCVFTVNMSEWVNENEIKTHINHLTDNTYWRTLDTRKTVSCNMLPFLDEKPAWWMPTLVFDI